MNSFLYVLLRCIFGDKDAEYLGSVDAVYPTCSKAETDQANMLSFIKQREYEPVYRAIAYQSRTEWHRDARHYAVAWYFQNPELMDTNKYNSWVLKDVKDPRLWYRASIFRARGMISSATFTDVPGIGTCGYSDSDPDRIRDSSMSDPDSIKD